MTMTPLTVALDVSDSRRAAAVYALRALALRLGLPFRLVPFNARPLLLYTEWAVPAVGAHLSIKLDPGLYDPWTRCAAQVFEGNTLWLRADADPREHDPIGATFRLLALLDEAQVSNEDRDALGVFADTALPAARQGVAGVALVEHQARDLWRRIAAAGLEGIPEISSPWPAGAGAAVVLSHDVDSMHLGAVSELAANLAKAVLRRDRRYLALFFSGTRYVGRFQANPFLAFKQWASWEREREMRSAFYLFVRPRGVRREQHDCRTSVVNQKVDWGQLRVMVDHGWEVGVHASIGSKDTANALTDAREWIEERLARPVVGVRHHYLALDWWRPHVTMRRQAEAGYLYDSSIGWRTRAGFRAGTCLPYEPFDTESQTTLAHTELPLTLMDNHVAGRGVHEGKVVGLGERLEEGLAAVREVASARGVLVINWHQEVFWDRHMHHGSVGLLGRVLEEARAWKGWYATPAEVASHWQRWSGQVLPRGSGLSLEDR
jgi:hypothetical protein